MNAPETIKAGEVFAAIARVTAALAKNGIGKDRTNTQQGYKFRGIDDVYNALSPDLSANQLCIIPTVLERAQEERATKDGKGLLLYTTVKVQYEIVSAVDGSRVIAVMYGEAMDSGDKSTNKAMSAAYKYLAMQLFCIPTEGDNDADATTHQVAPKEKPKSVGREAFDALEAEDKDWLRNLAMPIIADLEHQRLKEGTDKFHAATEQLAGTDPAYKAAFWSLLPSKHRAYLKDNAKPVAA